MTNSQLAEILDAVQGLPQGNDLSAALLTLAADSAKLKALKNTTNNSTEVSKNYFKFTKKEIDKMPSDIQRFFLFEEQMIYYRQIRGMYQARYNRGGYHIEVASKSFKVMKQKFLAEYIKQTAEMKNHSKLPLMKDFASEWLAFKKNTIKQSTYASYEILLNGEIIKNFGDKHIDQISRKDVQTYLNGLIDNGNNRTAQKAKQMLSAIFDIAVADYDIKSPMTKIVLPHYETEKGTPLSITEEKNLVDYCLSHMDCKASHALLILVYTGMRIGELKSATLHENYIECETEKIRKGYAKEIRKIPISPMLKRVLPQIDFEKAVDCGSKTASDRLKRIFPNRHLHELRYTFISRCKEFGCQLELVMLWDGHKFDKDVASSKVDRGYTRYSDEFYFSEIEKVNYELK